MTKQGVKEKDKIPEHHGSHDPSTSDAEEEPTEAEIWYVHCICKLIS